MKLLRYADEMGIDEVSIEAAVEAEDKKTTVQEKLASIASSAPLGPLL